MSNRELLRAISSAKTHVGATVRSEHVALNPPADDTAIALLSASLGKSPPQELIDWLLIHNGEVGSVGFFGLGVHLMTAQEIASAYLFAVGCEGVDQDDDFVEVIGPVRRLRASRRWIPFAQVNNDMAFLDFSPAIGGKEGQVVFVDSINGRNEVMYSSIADMFSAMNT